ncbi:hypothetical protein AAHA92_14297 [Salvia divinorum]|uniref:J domain-containing protein n=1 Tax=Salvia divinorum TaxID=28513 RepID=A0ABD1HB35_SALDI
MEVECREGYYALLGVSFHSSDDEIRRAYNYHKLAMQWHPDKWNATPSLVDMAKHKFQQIQEACSVLSDRTKRALYDAGMFDEEDHEGFSDFVQEMMSLVNDVRKETALKKWKACFGRWQKLMRFLNGLPINSSQAQQKNLGSIRNMLVNFWALTSQFNLM